MQMIQISTSRWLASDLSSAIELDLVLLRTRLPHPTQAVTRPNTPGIPVKNPSAATKSPLARLRGPWATLKLVCLSSLAVCMTLGVANRRTATPTLLRELLSKQLLLDERWADYHRLYNQALSIALRTTDFEDRFQINQPPRDDFVNLYLLDSGQRFRADVSPDCLSLFGKCCYLGSHNAIIIDPNFLQSFLTERGISGYRPVDTSRIPNNLSLAVWIVGHEVGHLLSNHIAAHFERSALEDDPSSGRESHERELAADAHVARIVRDDSSTQRKLVNLFYDLAWAEAEHQARGSYPNPPPEPTSVDTIIEGLHYSRGGSHPHYLVRVYHILRLMADDMPPSEGGKGFADMLSRFANKLQPLEDK
jgi:hypothetical protein